MKISSDMERRERLCSDSSKTSKPALQSPSAEMGEKQAGVAASGEMHWEVVQRILFIYALLNPGTGYVQVSLACSLSPLFFFYFHCRYARP